MKLKRFDELNETNDFPVNTHIILSNLEEGFAVSVSKNDLEYFYKAISYYDWIDFVKLDTEVIPDNLYFVLIGKKLYHTDRPTFGGQDFEIYTPSFQ